MKLFYFLIFAVLVQSTVVLAAAPKKATPALLSQGKTLFMQNCMSCHGEEGRGDGPVGLTMNPKPRNLLTDNFKNGTSPAQIFKTVSNGIPGTLMVSYASLPENDRWALAFYILNIRTIKAK